MCYVTSHSMQSSYTMKLNETLCYCSTLLCVCVLCLDRLEDDYVFPYSFLSIRLSSNDDWTWAYLKIVPFHEYREKQKKIETFLNLYKSIMDYKVQCFSFFFAIFPTILLIGILMVGERRRKTYKNKYVAFFASHISIFIVLSHEMSWFWIRL